MQQKEKIEEINKDLTDSINYAKRIQLQLLPEKDHFSSILPSSFVFYKPKDIVSGDFFWIKEIGDEIILDLCRLHRSWSSWWFYEYDPALY